MTCEHVWPNWLVRTGFPNEPNIIESRPPHRLPTQYGPMRPPSTTVKTVCAKRNNGWMSRREQAGRPVLTPIISASGRSWNRPSYLPVTLCAFKTAWIEMLWSQGDEDSPPVPSSDDVDLSNLRESFHPPERVLVWIGRYGNQELRLSTQVTPVVFKRKRAAVAFAPTNLYFRSPDTSPRPPRSFRRACSTGSTWVFQSPPLRVIVHPSWVDHTGNRVPKSWSSIVSGHPGCLSIRFERPAELFCATRSGLVLERFVAGSELEEEWSL